MNRPRLKGKRRAIALRKVNSSVRHISKFDRNQSAGKVSRLMRRTLTEEQTRIMSCKPQERVFLPEVLELLGSSPGYGETKCRGTSRSVRDQEILGSRSRGFGGRWTE